VRRLRRGRAAPAPRPPAGTARPPRCRCPRPLPSPRSCAPRGAACSLSSVLSSLCHRPGPPGQPALICFFICWRMKVVDPAL